MSAGVAIDLRAARYRIRHRVLIGALAATACLAALLAAGLDAASAGAAAVLLSVLAAALSGPLLGPGPESRQRFEATAIGVMGGLSALSALVTFGIVIALFFESARFFSLTPIGDFLGGTVWSPQMAIRADQVGAAGAFGVLPLVTGTLLITIIAMLVAGPIGVLSAIYLNAYANPARRDAYKVALELLAGVPTVVYGFFALLMVGPFFAGAAQGIARLFGAEIAVSAQNALAAGFVMGVMIIPFVSSLADDVVSAIPASLREGGLALGATKSETYLGIILPAAAPGLIAALMLAVSRAIGETMIVVMAASRTANLTFNPLERVTTMTVQIVALLTGDQEFDSPKTLAAFALGLVLFFATLALNLAALFAARRFRLRYE
ncbi:MAG: phosphate ABC transporter permease subunit PstC [Parvularculaceae bacterium]|nr:phosphate ABC transporter permease subunit PstC [Parvularculaceae bacterium]